MGDSSTVEQQTLTPSILVRILVPQPYNILISRRVVSLRSLLGALAVGVFGATVDTRLAELQVPPEIRRALNAEVPKFAEAMVPPQFEGEQRRMLEEVLDESFVRSFRVAMLVAAGLALASALCAGLMISPQRRNPPVD